MSGEAGQGRVGGGRLVSGLARWLVMALGWVAWEGVGADATGAAPVDFNRQIRPLLSDRCFACHGPDDQARKGRLALDTRDGALRGGRSRHAALVPGDAEGSELWRRVVSDDPEERMPPPESKLPELTAEELATLKRWIEEGAEYREHWAFLSPKREQPPEVGEAHPVDAWVKERLSREGLDFQPEVTRELWLRRVTFDLTGLPPTPEEIDALEADAAPGAEERVVDRLLASPHYGERMAQEWLDLARYADTFGYQADAEVDFSPWRDWVIRAFNDNLSWDQFITWQLAGDLLPGAGKDALLATAFNRLHRQTNEGGSIEEEFRAEYVADRVHTMGTAFLALTLECSRCHDHKYDPISQRDYYRLFAYFNSIDESGLYSHFTRATPTPAMPLWKEGEEERHRQAVEAVHQAGLELEKVAQEARARFPGAKAVAGMVAMPRPVAHLAFETLDGRRVPDAVSTNFAVLHDGPEAVEGRVGRALRFSGDNSAVLTFAGRYGRVDPFSVALWVRPEERQPRAVVFHRSRAWTDSGSRGYELVLEDGRPFFGLIHFWPGNAVAVRALEPLPTGQWTHLTVTYDGSSRAQGLRLYRDGREMPLEIVRNHLTRDIEHRAEWGDADAGHVHLTLAGRFRDNGFRLGSIDEFQVFDTELTGLEVARLAGWEGADTVKSEEALFAHWLARKEGAYQQARAVLQEARAKENEAIQSVREIMVMQEMAEPRPTFVLMRGAYDAPGDPVVAALPERLPPLAFEGPPNRLGLAQWITHPEHPLTARVAVNRVWRMHFGHGLVRTTWDFGAQGEMPSHPELLDWLARWWMESGWDRKALHRLIVLSRTYRQSSTAPAEVLAKDPENRLLSRGPRHRLEAEQIRDAALAASGLLVRKVGGPSVKPYQPAGVWEDAGTGKSYTQDKGDKLHRRSLYTFWRRTAPPPSLLTFDATSREVCTAKRESTATPLQALVLLNDPQYLEAARVLAGQLLEQHPEDLGARIEEAFRRLLGRRPDVRERELVEELYLEQISHFAARPQDARAFLAVGEVRSPDDLPPVILAATAVMTGALMNHDGFVMKR